MQPFCKECNRLVLDAPVRQAAGTGGFSIGTQPASGARRGVATNYSDAVCDVLQTYKYRREQRSLSLNFICGLPSFIRAREIITLAIIYIITNSVRFGRFSRQRV